MGHAHALVSNQNFVLNVKSLNLKQPLNFLFCCSESGDEKPVEKTKKKKGKDADR
jgi:hypothetical protein